jgi:hypothetical protein
MVIATDNEGHEGPVGSKEVRRGQAADSKAMDAVSGSCQLYLIIPVLGRQVVGQELGSVCSAIVAFA